jgi:hypothetical protein
MNTPKTPLVQKLILVMLVLIFGVLVVILVKGSKQIESIREGNGQTVSISTNPNEPTDVRKAFPSLRSSKKSAPTKAAQPEPEQPKAAAAPVPAPTKVEESPVVEAPPTILPTGTVVVTKAEPLEQAGLFGKVVLVGTPQPEKVIKFDQVCGAMHDQPVTTRHFVVSPDGGLANVLVYISRGTERLHYAMPITPVLIDQKDCMYQPYVVGAMVNQPIEFKNSDPILHNIHSLPKVSGNMEFNIAQPLKDQSDLRYFSKPEVFVKVKCEVHDWMFAYVGVVSHPFFAVTDTNGVFQLPDGLPPGTYDITAAHLKAGTVTQRFNYKKDGRVNLEIRLRADGKNSTAIAFKN